MGEAADVFLSSFNRIEKWLRNELGNPKNMGFSQMVRKLSSQSKLGVHKFEDDLLQMSQLRNAIVHEKISEDFVIAEPNEWLVEQILSIESELLRPELVLPRFGKHVTGFEQDLPLQELLKIVAQKRYSQFPLYKKGKFQGLITLRGLGYWLAKETLSGELLLAGRKAKELLFSDGKQSNYAFVSEQTSVHTAEQMFRDNGVLDAILITKDGNPNGQLLGIIRPRDIFTLIEKS
jgi:Hemolysins and related proteins containing CBS domains